MTEPTNKQTEIEQGAFTVIVGDDDYGKRLDAFVAEKFDGITRSLAATLIKRAHVRVGGRARKCGHKVRPGEVVAAILPKPEEPTFEPENLPLDILFEDSHLVVLNKRAGMVVHPAPGHYSGTLVNGLLYHCPDIVGTGCELRPGIVHRLDKDTSGVMVVAKTPLCHTRLSAMFKNREIYKQYTAVVFGDIREESGVVDLPVGRHPRDRKRMCTHSPVGKPAVTHYKINGRYGHATRVDFVLKTGRTHQIRVHCLSMGHPIVGDPVYMTKNRFRRNGGAESAIFRQIDRQMLHSEVLAFVHPMTETPLSFTAPLPEDMNGLINKLATLK